MSKAPGRVWLQWIPSDIPSNDEITWCVDLIHEDDVGYVREDIADKRLGLLRRGIKPLNSVEWKIWVEDVESELAAEVIK